MDWYYGTGINDFLVPKDQELLDRHPSPPGYYWSNWGISATEGFNSPKRFLIMDPNASEVEFNFIDERFNNEIEFESSLHDKDQSSSSSVCGGLPEQSFQQTTALSCDQPNFQLQDLSRFEQMDDIFLDSVTEDLPCDENPCKPFNFSPDKQCSNTSGGLQKDIAASKFVSCNSKSKDCLNIEALPANVLDPFELYSRNENMLADELSSLEESILQDLEMVIGQFTEKTRICFRDALYRLARNTEQQHVVQDQNGDLNTHKAMRQMDQNETVRSLDTKPMESETNSVDRVIASLMFNKMEFNIRDLPLTTSVNSEQEVIGGKGLQGKSSKPSNPAQKFHYPHLQNLPGDAEVPRFGLTNQQRATESHAAYGDPRKRSFMLEFG